MKPIRSQVGRDLRWHRIRLLPTTYELRAGDEVVATLMSRGWFRRTAEITLAEDRWLIRPPALFSRSLLIERLADGQRVASYVGRFRGGELTFESGERYTLSRQGLLPLSIRVQNETGSTILALHWSWPSFRRAGRVQIEPAGAADPHLGLLAATAFQVLLLRRRRARRSSG